MMLEAILGNFPPFRCHPNNDTDPLRKRVREADKNAIHDMILIIYYWLCWQDKAS